MIDRSSFRTSPSTWFLPTQIKAYGVSNWLTGSRHHIVSRKKLGNAGNENHHRFFCSFLSEVNNCLFVAPLRLLPSLSSSHWNRIPILLRQQSVPPLSLHRVLWNLNFSEVVNMNFYGRKVGFVLAFFKGFFCCGFFVFLWSYFCDEVVSGMEESLFFSFLVVVLCDVCLFAFFVHGDRE